MIFLTGDTHGAKGIIDRFKNINNFPTNMPLIKDDIVIVLGDFGLPWNNNGTDQYVLQWLEEQPWTTVFIDGNHENFSILNSLPIRIWKNGMVHELRKNVLHLIRGEVYSIDGKTFMALGGASSIDKDFRIPGKEWWSEETWNHEDIVSISIHSSEPVDYVLAHTAPEEVINKFANYGAYLKSDIISTIMSSLKIQFKTKWLFGHIHEEKCIGKYQSLYKSIIKL